MHTPVPLPDSSPDHDLPTGAIEEATAHLRDVLTHVSTHPESPVEELTPRRWKAARAAATPTS